MPAPCIYLQAPYLCPSCGWPLAHIAVDSSSSARPCQRQLGQPDRLCNYAESALGNFDPDSTEHIIKSIDIL